MTRRPDRGRSRAGRRSAGAEPVAPRHLYIHVPFCRRKCDYCDFFSLPLASGGAGAGPDGRSTDLLDRFVEALLREWETERRACAVRRLHTVYLGGGTPSLLGAARLERLVAVLQPYLTPAAEVSVEMNPEDVDEGLAGWATRRGVRVSLGVQSFDPALRRSVGRRAAADPAAAYGRLRRAGVKNVGIDLMYGLPGQTMAGIESELATVAALKPDHVSWYELELATGTSLASRLGAREPRFGSRPGAGRPLAPGMAAPCAETTAASGRPDADQRAEMYRLIVRALGRLGLRWYEVSNFSRPGCRCRHNMAVWRGQDYLGLGPGSVSTLGRLRWRVTPDVPAYLAASAGSGHAAPEGPPGDCRLPDAGRAGGPRAAPTVPRRGGSAAPREIERLSPHDRLRERLYLASRIGLPLPLAELAPVLDTEALDRLVAAGFVAVAAAAGGGTLRVTRKGRYVADDVCVRLFRASHVEGTA